MNATTRRVIHLQQTLTVTTGSAYTAKDGVGGLLTFTNVLGGPHYTGKLVGVTLFDPADQVVPYDLVLFRSTPQGGVYADKNGFAFGASDGALLLHSLQINTTDHFSYNSGGLSTVQSLEHRVYSFFNGTVCGVLVTRGTPTYSANLRLLTSWETD